VIKTKRWNRVHSEQLGSLQSSVASHYDALRVDQNRIGETELFDRLRDQFDLALGMFSGIAAVRA
jgi:hypothetical protein